MAQLSLVRHGESEWNSKNLFTGWTDKLLTEKGFAEARAAAEKLRGVNWDIIFESDLLRVKETTEVIIKTLDLRVPTIETPALRERSYGIYTQRNKLDVQKELGPVEFEKLHRGWNFPIEGGESLKQVYERAVPFFQMEIEPRWKEGQNVIVAASGNSLRAVSKYLRNLSDEEIENLEIKTGEVVIISFPTL